MIEVWGDCRIRNSPTNRSLFNHSLWFKGKLWMREGNELPLWTAVPTENGGAELCFCWRSWCFLINRNCPDLKTTKNGTLSFSPVYKTLFLYISEYMIKHPAFSFIWETAASAGYFFSPDSICSAPAFSVKIIWWRVGPSSRGGDRGAARVCTSPSGIWLATSGATLPDLEDDR